MTRKEWRAYNKRMKELNKKSKEVPDQTTIEELKELTDWNLESARRNIKSAEVWLNAKHTKEDEIFSLDKKKVGTK